MPQRKTIPMGLIPTVCGAVKFIQSNNVSNIMSVSDLKREGLELAKDAMRRALSKRVLEMTPNGNFRLKVITDKKMASNLVENTYLKPLKRNSKSKPKSKNINKKGTKLQKTDKRNCSTRDKSIRTAKAPSIFNKPPSRTEKIIEKRLNRKKERKIKPKIVQCDTISDISSNEDGSTKATTNKKKPQKKRSHKSAEKKGGLPFRTEKIIKKKLIKKKERTIKPKIIKCDIISHTKSSEDDNEIATTSEKKTQKKEGSDKSIKKSLKKVKGNIKTREDFKTKTSDQSNEETQSNEKILSIKPGKRKRPAFEEEEIDSNMNDIN